MKILLAISGVIIPVVLATWNMMTGDLPRVHAFLLLAILNTLIFQTLSTERKRRRRAAKEAT